MKDDIILPEEEIKSVLDWQQALDDKNMVKVGFTTETWLAFGKAQC